MNERDDFAVKRALDALPRAIEPPGDDLWPGIRAKLVSAPGHRRTGAPALLNTPRLRIAALLTVLGIAAGALRVSQQRAGRWEVAEAAGSARRFTVGQQVTGAARFTVGTIGQVQADSGTSVQLLAARWSEHRLALSRGTLHARIYAPPRLFVVETPTGTAIDLGCEYTLAVDSAGNSLLRVTAGWVEFTERGRTSLIPAGFSARSRHGTGVGIPVDDYAPAALADAVHALEAFAMSNDSALGVILRESRPRDAVTLWHLLNGWRGSVEMRRRVYDRLAAVVPPPVPNAEFAAVYGDPWTMRLWWEKLPGTLPIVAGWQRVLWTTWLRVFG